MSCIVLQLVHGQVTDVFARHPEPARAHLSFSLLYEEEGVVRTLDLTCPTQRDFEYWVFGIKVCRQLKITTSWTNHSGWSKWNALSTS